MNLINESMQRRLISEYRERVFAIIGMLGYSIDDTTGYAIDSRFRLTGVQGKCMVQFECTGSRHRMLYATLCYPTCFGTQSGWVPSGTKFKFNMNKTNEQIVNEIKTTCLNAYEAEVNGGTK